MKTWNVADYGARFSDRPQTEKIQKAIDDCFLAGGGRVVVPCGVYLTGDLRLRSRVELYLESGAILKGVRDPEEYFHYRSDPLEPVAVEEIPRGVARSAVSTSRWCNALIRAFDAEDIAVVGEKGSYLDGSNVFDPEGESDYRGPHGICFWRCRNVHLEGYTFMHSSNWCHAIFQSQNVTIRRIAVFAGHDGVDLRTCDDVLIEKCEFQTGDDCVAGFDNNNVTVRNCILNTACMPVRFGGNHVLIENCVSDERRFGARGRLTKEEKIAGAITGPHTRHESHTVFSYYCDHRADPRKPAEDIVFRNCRFAQAREWMRLEFDGRHRWCCNRSLKGVAFENCEIGDLCQTGMIWGDPAEKATCVFRNCRVSCRKGYEKVPLFAAGNFERLVFEDCALEGFEDPSILVGTEGGEIEVVRSTPIRVVRTTEEACFEAHPHGLAGQDVGKNRSFR